MEMNSETPTTPMYDSYINNITNKNQNSLQPGASNYNSNLHEMPHSVSSDKTYKDFYKICKAYYKELKSLNANNQMLSKDDIIVLNDLIKELNFYVQVILKCNFIEEGKKLIDLGIKIVDFLLRIFNSYVKDKSEFNTTGSKASAPNQKIVYPFSIKLLLLETKFHLHFNLEHNYEEAEPVLNEILKIQKFLQLPQFNFGCSFFYSAIIKFFKNNVQDAESLAFEALKVFENKPKLSEKFNATATDDSQKVYVENRITRKISSVLEFLAEIYDLKKDFNNSLACYERAYYLNLGRYGTKNVNTEYFKIKIDIFNKKAKIEKKENNNKNTNNNSSQGYSNSNYNYSQTTSNKINLNKMVNNTFTNTNLNLNTNTNMIGLNKTTLILNSSQSQPQSQSNSYSAKISFKGTTSTFNFYVSYSNLYEPLIISIYDLNYYSSNNSNNENENIFIKNLYFDKNKLFKYFKIDKFSNTKLYSESIVNR